MKWEDRMITSRNLPDEIWIVSMVWMKSIMCIARIKLYSNHSSAQPSNGNAIRNASS